jgi:hypothetical protein
VRGKLTASVGNDLSVAGESNVTGDANLDAGHDLMISGTTTMGGKLTASVGNDLGVAGETSVTGDANFDAGHDLMFAGSSQIGGKLDAVAGRNAAIAGDVGVVGAIDLATGRDLHFNGGRLQGDGQARIVAGQTGTGNVLGSATSGPDMLISGDTFVRAADAIGANGTPLELSTDGELDLQAHRIYVTMTPIRPKKPVGLNITGANGSPVDVVGLDVLGAGDVVLHHLDVVQGRVETDSANLQVAQGHTDNFATFKTPYFNTRIDHLSRQPVASLDAQAFTLSGDFDLQLTARQADIDAFIISQNPRSNVVGNPPGSAVVTVEQNLHALQKQPNNFNGPLLPPSSLFPSNAPLVSIDPLSLADALTPPQP